MTVRAADKKKRETFSLVYAEHYPLIFSAVCAKIGNEHDAQDICQEIFMICYEKLGEIENHRKWLFGTMRNVLYRYYEKNAKNPLDLDAAFQDVSLTFVNGYRDIRILIEEALDKTKLTELEHLLITYIAFNSYSYSRAGAVLGLSKRQVGYRYQAAAGKILDFLRTKGIQNIEDLL